MSGTVGIIHGMVKREGEGEVDIDIDNTHPALAPRGSEKHPEIQRGNKTGVERTLVPLRRTVVPVVTDSAIHLKLRDQPYPAEPAIVWRLGVWSRDPQCRAKADRRIPSHAAASWTCLPACLSNPDTTLTTL